MRLTLTYIGTATEGRIALILSMRRRGYPVSSPVSLITMTPIIPSKKQAPLYIREGVSIPSPDNDFNYIVPAGGLVLDMCEYTEIVGSLNLLVGLPTWEDLLGEVFSLEVMCYYRPMGIPASILAQQIGAMTGVPRFGHLLFPPVSGFGLSEQGIGPIAECDGEEGFCCISKYMWLLQYLPRPIPTMYHPFSYDGGFWLPVNAPVYRYNLWDKPYSGVFGSQVIRYDWIVAHPDMHRDAETGEITNDLWSGALYESHGYMASLTAVSGIDMAFSGYKFTVRGGGSWLSAYAWIHEAVSVTGIAVANSSIIAAPPVDLHQYRTCKPVRLFGLRKAVEEKSDMTDALGMIGKVGKLASTGAYLRDENVEVITDENEEGIEQ